MATLILDQHRILILDQHRILMSFN